MQYFISFLEGIITFISPCLLPMLPIYISYFAGKGYKKTSKTLINSLFFVFGFTIVFLAMGALAGSFGLFLTKYSLLVNIVTGAVVILFGLNFIGIFKLNLFKGINSGKVKGEGVLSSLLLGIVFSVGWTPCVGAFLGSALMLASQQGTVVKGLLLLLCYSAGLGIPFVLSALLIDKLKSTFNFIKRNYKVINIISGSLLILVCILMMTGLLNRIITFLG